MKAGYRQSEQHRDNAGPTLTPSCANPPTLSSSVAAGSAAPSKEKTWSGKSASCEKDTPTPKSCPTSAEDSTSGEKDLFPYWSDFTAAISSELWLPIETGLPGSIRAYPVACRTERRRDPGSQQRGLQPRTGTHPGYSRHPPYFQLPTARPAPIPQRDQGGFGFIRRRRNARHSGCGLTPPGGVTTRP